ncbi:MAG TPA: AAA family ATPase [Trueperaceae bacterium]
MSSQLIVVFGLPGSGKSTLAERLAKRLGATALSSDVLRAELGLKGDYRMETISEVYRVMLKRAGAALESGGTVIVDGSFSNHRFREQAAAAARAAGADLVLIHMVANEETTLERVGRKRKLSEAGPEAYALLKERFRAVEGEHLRLDSSETPVWRLVRQAEEYVASRRARSAKVNLLG